MVMTRRGLIAGLGGLLAAPAIVRVSSLMPVKAIKSPEALWAEIADTLYRREFIAEFEQKHSWLRPLVVHEFVADGELRFEVVDYDQFAADAA